MFKKLLNIFTNENENIETDSKALFASLLVRAARIDNEYTESEKSQISLIIENKFHISPSDAKKIRIEGELIETNTLDTVQITREIKKDIPFEYRKTLAEDLWSIVLADSKRTDDENSFMRTCIKLIGLSDVDSANARHAVIKKLELKNNEK